MTIQIRKGNLAPSLHDTLRVAGTAFDLTGATVKLKARFQRETALKINAAATVVSASSMLVGDHVLPESTITVASTTGFLPSGALTCGGQIVEYEAISGNSFLGCYGGSGTVANGVTVAQRGGVRYDWVAADVDTAGDLDAWWEVTLPGGKVQESPTFDIEIVDPAIAARGLCELSDVYSYAPGYRSNPTTDALLERLILAESRAIQRETRREFIARHPAVPVRRFELGSWEVAQRKVGVGALQTITTVRIIAEDQTTVVRAVTSADYVTLPRVRDASWEPITHLEFPLASASPVDLQVGQILEVDGVWGYPAVPEDIREACAKLVIARYALDAANAGTLLSESLAEVNVGALFASSRAVIEHHALLPPGA